MKIQVSAKTPDSFVTRRTRAPRPPRTTAPYNEDVKTPDNWIKRHPHLIRLTGKHPFNVEANLPEMFDYGFIGPVNLHIVRNHGAVPRLKWETHRISFGGNVPKPFDIGMDELVAMPTARLSTNIPRPSTNTPRPSRHLDRIHTSNVCTPRLSTHLRSTHTLYELYKATLGLKHGWRANGGSLWRRPWPEETFPALVVCAGNRRKEQNMIKRSIGFNWGPCGIGNTMWKGVPLRLLLNRAGRGSFVHVSFVYSSTCH